MQRSVAIILAAIVAISVGILWDMWPSQPGTVSVQRYRDGFSFSVGTLDNELLIRAIGEEPKELKEMAGFNEWSSPRCITEEEKPDPIRYPLLLWPEQTCAQDDAGNIEYLLPPHRYEVRLGTMGVVIACRNEECRACSITQPWEGNEITVKPGKRLTLNISDEAIAQAEKCFREEPVRYAPGIADVPFEVFTNPCSDDCGECDEYPNQSQ